MTVRSPWRTLLYEKLAQVELQGEVLDLGGSRKSDYVKGFRGDHRMTMANLEADQAEDIEIDLERPFTIADASYDGAVCINVLEHIYNYQNVLNETKRVLKSGSTAVFAVPFLVQVHPSPRDHWRFTADTLEKLFRDAGFSEVRVEPVGRGVCTAAVQLMFNILHFSVVRAVAAGIARAIDWLVSKFVKSDSYGRDFYPLGYVVTAKKR